MDLLKQGVVDMGNQDVIDKTNRLIKRWQFSVKARSLESSIIRDILKELSRPGIINFAGGFPAPELFPIDEINAACGRILDKHGPESLQYSLTTGLPVLRQFLADRISSGGIDCSPEEIQITGGSQQGLDIIGRVFLESGSVVLTEEPTYLGAIQAFSFYDARFVSVATDEDGMLPDDLESKIKKHNPAFIYVVPDFQNPAGYTWSESRRVALIDLAKRYDVPVVDDNPYCELRYLGKAPSSLKILGGEHVIQLGTFSKLISPGLRIGWIAADKEIINLCERMKQACDLHTNTFCQYVVYEFSRENGLEKHIETIKKAYGSRRGVMMDALQTHMNDETEWTEPEGGLFLWVKLPAGVSGSNLLSNALEAGVAYIPGKYFFSDRPDDSTLRLNFCNATEDNIVEGVKRLAKVIKESE